MACCVYILRSLKDGGLYTGSSGDLKRRFAEHARGRVASTRHRRPLELVYVEEQEERLSATKRERYLKSLEGGPEKFRLVASQTDEAVAGLRARYLPEGAGDESG